MDTKHYEVVIVGGGISGAALFYELARYTDAKSICMLETIHVGDIETNYTLDKAKITKRTANMIVKFNLMRGLQDKIMFAHQKMALGVGDKEVEFIKNRYEEFKELFPYLELWDKEKLRELEPKLVYADKEQTKDRPEPIIAMGTQSEYTTVDFGAKRQKLIFFIMQKLKR
jgi:malate dehydrogenase (quinone)